MQIIRRFFQTSQLERQKLLVSGSLFFFIIASYSIAKELQYLIFNATVGVTYVPLAKLLGIIMLLPFIFVDGFLVDRLKRYQILGLYLLIYSIIGFSFFCLLGMPEIGLSNPDKGTHRIIGWMFFLYVEGYIIFIVSVAWAFFNSIHKPGHAEHTYGFIVSCSKIGGICSVIFAYLLFSKVSLDGFSDVHKLRLLLLISSSLLGFGVMVLYIALRKMPADVFAGYHTSVGEKVKKTGAAEGIKLIFKQPYVLGIFGIVFCCDIMIEVVNYQRLLVVMVEKTANHIKPIGEMAATLYSQTSMMHITGFILSFFVTNGLMRFLGTKISLFVPPMLVSALVIIYFVTGYDNVLVALYVILHALSYSVNAPIRESLYIVTSRDIQLKSKFAVDAVGIKVSRGAGHLFNLVMSKIFVGAKTHIVLLANNVFFMFIVSLWFVVCALVGNRYAKAKRDSEVIS
ncbi:ATP:ADP antiporter, AAA family [Alphaproteobacteria bacterium]